MLTASWEDRDKTLWIELEGELDHDDCLKIRDEFNDRIEKGDGDVIIVMTGLTFLSSMGIGMLVKAHNRLKAQGRELKLSGVPEKIRKVFEATQLLDVFSLL
ncbi:MAG: STAS domain-containing protein [Planctomycetota bacterium]|jgi:anti-sigma B factor antagonist